MTNIRSHMIYLFTAYQLFKILMNNVDKLIASMKLTDEILNTQFYDTIEEYKTLYYKKHNCRL